MLITEWMTSNPENRSHKIWQHFLFQTLIYGLGFQRVIHHFQIQLAATPVLAGDNVPSSNILFDSVEQGELVPLAQHCQKVYLSWERCLRLPLG